MKKGD